MKNGLNELSDFKREVTTLALMGVKTFNVDTLINICNATDNFDVAVLMLLNKYEEPHVPLKGMMTTSSDKVLTVCNLISYNPFLHEVSYSYCAYERKYDSNLKQYVKTSKIVKGKDTCSYETWMKAVNLFNADTPLEGVEVLNR